MSNEPRSPLPDPLQAFALPDLAWEIRVATAGDEPWFVVSDVEGLFGSEYLDHAVGRLDEDDRGSVTLPTGSALAVVSEPALYALALGSGHRLAGRFVRWISHEVVPAVCRDAAGVGHLGRRELAQLIIDAEDARERAEARAGELAAVSAELASKAEAFDAFLEADGTYSMGAVANLLGIGRNNLFRRLREEKILQTDNRPYQRYTRHFRVTAGAHEQNGREVGHYTTQVHASGVDFIRRRLKAPGPLAMARPTGRPPSAPAHD